jgi:hypothetical protein
MEQYGEIRGNETTIQKAVAPIPVLQQKPAKTKQ